MSTVPPVIPYWLAKQEWVLKLWSFFTTTAKEEWVLKLLSFFCVLGQIILYTIEHSSLLHHTYDWPSTKIKYSTVACNLQFIACNCYGFNNTTTSRLLLNLWWKSVFIHSYRQERIPLFRHFPQNIRSSQQSNGTLTTTRTLLKKIQHPTLPLLFALQSTHFHYNEHVILSNILTTSTSNHHVQL